VVIIIYVGHKTKNEVVSALILRKKEKEKALKNGI